MPLAPVPLTAHAAYVDAPTSIGIVTNGDRAVLVDSGLDENLARKVSNHLTESGVALEAIVVTHAHADHFGGNAFLLERHPDARVVAPAIEEAFLRYPELEPMSMVGGAAPPVFRNKFLEAPPSPVHDVVGGGDSRELAGIPFRFHALPGHSVNQLGVEADGALFLSDTLLPGGHLEKHGLPYALDAARARESCRAVRKITHVEAHTYHGGRVTDLEDLVDANVAAWDSVFEAVRAAVSRGPAGADEATRRMREAGVRFRDTPDGWLLATCTVRGALAGLARQGDVVLECGPRGLEYRTNA